MLNSKVAFLKSGQNMAVICPFFLRCNENHKKRNIPLYTFVLRALRSSRPDYPFEKNQLYAIIAFFFS